MSKIKFAVIGGGWRAEFFLRIASAASGQFEVTSVLMRSAEKAKLFAEKTGAKTVLTLDELLADNPDFAVLSIAKPAVPDYLIKLFELGVPVLCETPPALNADDMVRLYTAAKQTGAKVQIAEQYPFQPLYASWLSAVNAGLIGEVSNLNISAVHSYHAVCLIRRFLGAGFKNAEIFGRRYSFEARVTDSRDGIIENGGIESFNRDRLTFVFDGGKTAFFDFSSVQYHSFIRTRHFSVQGTQGEIDDLTVRYMNRQNRPITAELVRRDLGVYNNNHFANYGISLGGEYLYVNPLPYARLNDDELAVAQCLIKMKAYLETGKSFYSLADGLQDAYFALCTEQALTCDMQKIKTETMPWAE